MEAKRGYIKSIRTKYPKIQITEEDMINLNIAELKRKVLKLLEEGKFNGAAISIQQMWRKQSKIIKNMGQVMLKQISARKIQRAWKRYNVWLTEHRRQMRELYMKVSTIQKYVRGYLSYKSWFK